MNIPEILRRKVRRLSCGDYDKQANFVSRLFYINLLMAIFVIWIFFSLRLEVKYPDGVTRRETIKSICLSKTGLKR